MRRAECPQPTQCPSLANFGTAQFGQYLFQEGIIVIIALRSNHPAAGQLASLSSDLRRLHRREPSRAPTDLPLSINLHETLHGSGCTTYEIAPGSAEANSAIEAYQYLRRVHPFVLDIFCFSVARGADRITIEIGTLSPQDSLSWSHHDLLQIMPRVLAFFRGTISPPHARPSSVFGI